jgi:hypothetical protein
MLQIIVIILFSIIAPREALSYVGPGAGIGAIGAVIAIFFALILAILAFVWYPIKRLAAKFKKPKNRKTS